MVKKKIIVIFVKLFIELTFCEISSNEIYQKTTKKETSIYWNIPTFQCDSHKLNFTELAAKYNIKQNENDRFHGDVISILYDPGSFPALLKNGTQTIPRNGGLPQQGSLGYHIKLFQQLINELIPDEDFSGIGVIDFESWRPVFRQNFGTLSPYKDLSIQLERKLHPLWLNFWLEKEATKRFEFYGRQFMEETLFQAKHLRPNATWGYYAYPYCFNMSPNNMKTDCPNEVLRENERTKWLFNLTDNLYPSLYLENYRLNAREKVQMVEGRINEAHRLIGYLNKRRNIPKIIPYIWFKYHDTKKFLSKDDLFNILTVLSGSNIDGLVLWGSSNDVNSRSNCLSLYQYVDDVLGPLLINTF